MAVRPLTYTLLCYSNENDERIELAAKIPTGHVPTNQSDISPTVLNLAASHGLGIVPRQALT